MDTPKPSQGAEYYNVKASDGVEYGPCSLDQVQELVKQGQIKATTMIFKKSLNRWHLAASIGEVRALLRKYNPTQNSALNRIRALGSSNSASSRIIGRISTIGIKKGSIRAKLSFWKRFFGRK